MVLGRSHFHHKLLNLGLKHRHAVIIAYIITLMITGLGLFMMVTRNIQTLIVFAALLLLLLMGRSNPDAAAFAIIIGSVVCCAAAIAGDVEEELPDWEIQVGPRDGAHIPAYLKAWTPSGSIPPHASRASSRGG